MADVLEEILTARRRHLKLTKEAVSLAELEEKVKRASPRPGFEQAIRQTGSIALIAEMKRRSPSAGLLREPYDVQSIAKAYEDAGAHALSVLTEADHFGGDIQHIGMLQETSQLPILRKDFIFDPYQVMEAKAYGASAFLLIADMLDATALKELVDYAKEVHLDPLVEVFTTTSLPAALNSGAKIIGINTRNLRTLEMNPDNVVLLSQLIPKDRLIVAESGIKTPDDMRRLKRLRVSAALIGESLLKQNDLVQATKAMVEAGQ